MLTRQLLSASDYDENDHYQRWGGKGWVLSLVIKLWLVPMLYMLCIIKDLLWCRLVTFLQCTESVDNIILLHSYGRYAYSP